MFLRIKYANHSQFIHKSKKRQAIIDQWFLNPYHGGFSATLVSWCPGALPIVEIIVLFMLIVINGIFALTEAAFLSCRQSYLHDQKKKGKTQALFLLKQLDKPENFLSSIQVCITLIGIISGAFGGMALADDLEAVFFGWGWVASWSGDLALALVILLITYFSIVLGELVPKTLAMRNPERIALFFSPLIRVVMFVFKPIIAVLSFSTRSLLWLTGMTKKTQDPDVVNEIVSIIKMASATKELEIEQEKIILSTINSTKAKIHDIMIAVDQIQTVSKDDSLELTLEAMFQYRHTRYPVRGSGMDDIVGYVNIKDLSYFYISEYRDVSVANITRPIARLNHNLNLLDALRVMMQGSSHIALAVDKNQKTRGLVTLEDIIEYILGDINDEYDSVPEYFFSMGVEQFIMGGGAKLADMAPGIVFPGHDSTSTISSWLLTAGLAPLVGQSINVQGYHFVVTKTRNQKIIELTAKHIPAG